MKQSQIVQAADLCGWACSISKEKSMYFAEFETYTDFGQDVVVSVYAHKLTDFGYSLYEYYENYDVSEETSLWIDPSGHGKNGAPYRLEDVLNDMKEAEERIGELAKAVCALCGYDYK